MLFNYNRPAGRYLVIMTTVMAVILGSAALCAGDDKPARTYLEDPDMFLQPRRVDSTGAGHAAARGLSHPSPTGSGIHYARAEVEPVISPSLEGIYTPTRIPATLDLAERADLYIRGATSCVNPKADYEIYGWMGHVRPGNVMMHHSYNDYNGGQAKWLQNLPYARTMSGSTMNEHVDVGMMETLFRMIGPDGLYYIPVLGAPWHNAWDSKQRVAPGLEQHFDSWPNGRALLCLVSWFARNPGDRALKANIDRMIGGLLRIASRKDNAAWVTDHMTNLDLRTDIPLPVKGVLSQGTTLPGVARYYALTGDEKARQLGEMLVSYWLEHSRVFKPNGEWNLEPSLHFHGTTFAMGGLLYWALATGDEALLHKISTGYQFARSHGVRELGWFPESAPAMHPNTEPCGIGDMTMLASVLSESGAGDYWEDVEYYTRNLLSEVQLTDTWFLKQMAAGALTKPEDRYMPEEPLETGEDVADRMIGVFAGMAAPGGQFQTVSSHCCTGNAFRGMYFAWRNILSVKDNMLNVNLLLNRSSSWADINSLLPYQGRIEIKMKQDMSLRVRIPGWVQDRSTVMCRVENRTIEPFWEGPYVVFDDLDSGQTCSICFPLRDETVQVAVRWSDDQGSHEQPYSLRLRGFNVVDMWPRKSDILHAFFTNTDYRSDRVLWKDVLRFTPEREGYW